MKDVIELNYSMSVRKSLNSGIEILKLILTFLILLYHSLNENTIENKILKILIKIVPLYFSTFFLIFFYFAYSIFSSRNIIKIRQRFIRLLVPYIYWPFIFLVLHAFLNDKKIKTNNLLRDFFIQLLIGRRIYFIFWFQFNLLFIMLIFSIITLFFKKFYLHIFILLFVISYLVEYLGFVELIFLNYNEDLKRSVGRIFKMMIFAITGFFLSSVKLLNNLKKRKIQNIIISIISSGIIIVLKIYLSNYYFLEGIFLILGSVFLMVSFALLPLANISNMTITFLIKQSTSYTAGIYYLHFKVLKYLENNITIFEEGTLRGCALNYLICYSICFVGMKTIGKTRFKYLFI